MNRWLSSLALALPALLLATTAQAVRNPDYLDERPLETAAGERGRLVRMPTWQPPNRAQQQLWRQFTAAHGRWAAIWDEDTQVPMRVWGEGIPVPGANADPAIALAAARAMLDEQLAFLAPGSKLDHWQVAANVVHGRGGTMRTVSFVQVQDGLPVQGGGTSFLFKRDRLFLISSDARPSVAVQPPASVVRGAAATSQAVAWITDVYRAVPTVMAEGGVSVLPLIRDRDDGAPVIEYRVVKTVTLDLAEPRARWDVFVDAETGAPIARTQLLRFGAGTVQYNTPVRFPNGTRQNFPAALANLMVNGSPVTTDASGGFTYTGTGPAVVNTAVVGPRVRTTNNGAAGSASSLTIADGATGVWNAASTPALDAELTGFVHTNLIKAYALAELNPTLPWITRSLEVSVNESGQCNAYSTGDDIHFFRAGGGCENTGRLPDVIYHEFGHSIHNNSVIPGAGSFDSAMSEGISDYLAATTVDDPAMARGFFSSSSQPLRHIDPDGREYRWPQDIAEDPHSTGLIIAGALWDLRKAMQAMYGAEEGKRRADDLFYATLQRASDIPTTYAEVLAADDDDGNLLNGTPNKCMIDTAFGAHGLVDPLLGIGVGIPVRDDFSIRVPVTPPAGGCDAPDVTSVTVDWKLRDGNLQQVQLTETATDWSGVIPTQPDGSVVEYRVVIRVENGSVITYPENLGDPMYQFYVGPLTPIYCTDFESDPFAAGWTQGALAGTSDWQWGTPAGLGDDPRAAASGANVIGTDLGIGTNRDGEYERDVTTFVTSPVIDVSGHNGVRLQFKRWLNVEDGFYDDATVIADGTTVWGNYAGQDQSASTHTTDKEWRFVDVDLAAAAADGNVQIRFRLETDQGLQMGGWTIDDFCIMARGTGPADPVCGNSQVEAGEACDDGNTIDGDGCNATCGSETGAEDPGGCCSTGTDPRGAIALGLGSALLLVRRRRRRA